MLALAACGGAKKATQTAERPLTKTAAAVSQTVLDNEEFTAEIQPWAENSVMPAAQGVHIDRILVDVGQKVNRGQLLVTLDPTQYNQQQVVLQNMQTDYDRLLPVFKAGGISAQQIEQSRTQLAVQKEVVRNLAKNIRVTSPLTGVVTARNNDPGDLYAGQPILHLMQIDQLKVVVHIAEQFYANVKVGMPVNLFMEIYPNRTFKGTVSRIYPALDPATRTFTVEVKVPNGDQALRPGMYARTVFDMGSHTGTLISDVAVQKQSGSSERYIYVVEGDSVAVRRVVRTGRQVGDQVDILSGVAAGEQIAVTGFTRLADGAKVQVKNN